MESPTPKVLIAVLHQGYIRPELIKLTKSQADLKFYNLKPSETARNTTVIDALEGGYDYLISIDHDVVPLRDPVELTIFAKDIIGFAVPQWNMSDPSFPIYFVGMDKVDGGYQEHKKKEGLQEVDAVGTGCICLSRKVLQEISSPFIRKWNSKGIAIAGLDFYFCERAKEKGFQPYCNYDFIAEHYKEVGLLDVLNFKQS